MDYRPVAKRTRQQEALKFKQWHENKKNKKKAAKEEDVVEIMEIDNDHDVEEEEENEGSLCSRSGTKGFENSKELESVADVNSDGSEEVVVVEIGDETDCVGGGGADSVGSTAASKSLGVKDVSESKAGVGNSDNVSAIGADNDNVDIDDDGHVDIDGDDDDDDDDVVIIAEGRCLDPVRSDCWSLKVEGSGMSEGVLHIDGDEAISSGEGMCVKGNVGRNDDADDDGVVSIDSEDCSVGSEEEESSSSEEDNDDSEDEDFGMSQSCDSESSSSDSDNSSSYIREAECKNVGPSVNSRLSTDKIKVIRSESDDIEVVRSESDEVVERRDSRVEKRGSVDCEGEVKRVEAVLRKREVTEPNVLDDSYNHVTEKDSSNEVNKKTTVSKRTRSNFNSERMTLKNGTFSCPISVDEDESDSSLGNEDGGGFIYKGHEDEGGNGHGINDGKAHIIGLKTKENEVRSEKQSVKKHAPALKDYDVLKILVDSIMEKGEVLLEDLVSSKETKLPCGETSLPLKFTFEIEQSKMAEKSEYEKVLDQLWVEFEFVLRSSEIGEMDSSMADSVLDGSPEIKTDQATLCSQSKHQLILDDQIGIKCKFCSFVILEIKHILPSFMRQPWGKPGKKDCDKNGQSPFNDLQFQDSGNESMCGCDPKACSKGTVWDIIPGIRASMYPHQREGFEFIWKNIAGGIYLDKLKEPTSFDGGSGCIISHAPGTGKTRLTIVFLKAYMELFPTCRPLIIAPRSMLLTWEEEFKKWKVDIPFHNLNKSDLSGKENIAAVNFVWQARHQCRSVAFVRLLKLYSWKKDRSILGVSYRLFEKLAGGRVDGEQVRQILLELPGLLVLDEGHTPRNNQSLIWKAVSEIETDRRIILSGTPFQNNFGELYNTLCLVRPRFADRFSFKKFRDFGHKPSRRSSVEKRRWISLTNAVSDKLEELKAIIDPFVHVHKGTILQESLPGLRDSVVVLQPAEMQKSFLEAILVTRDMLRLGYLVSLISTHPSLLPECCLSEKQESFVDRDKLESLRLNPDVGVKTKFLMELIRLSEALNEKVLIFSQYLDTLTLIRDQLNSLYSWKEGKDVLYMDGQLDVKQRQTSMSLFNEPSSDVKVLLASTRACSEGINLVGASRVVLLDVCWNPSVERQAISRAYRLGQKKVVHIYHLITSGTMEGVKYCRQAKKNHVSELVFSSVGWSEDEQNIPSRVSEDKILDEMVHHEKLKCMFEKIIIQPKESNLVETFGLVES